MVQFGVESVPHPVLQVKSIGSQGWDWQDIVNLNEESNINVKEETMTDLWLLRMLSLGYIPDNATKLKFA